MKQSFVKEDPDKSHRQGKPACNDDWSWKTNGIVLRGYNFTWHYKQSYFMKNNFPKCPLTLVHFKTYVRFSNNWTWINTISRVDPYHCIYFKPKTRHCHQHPQLRLLWMLSLPHPHPLPHISIQSLQGEKWSERTLSKKITCDLLFLWLVIFSNGGPKSQLSLVLRYHPALGGWLHKFLNKIHKLCMFFASWNCAVSKVLILEWSCQTLISDISTIHTAFIL